MNASNDQRRWGLGIETSCDETGVALLEITGAATVFPPPPGALRLAVNNTQSQIDVHRVYGGVVPEVASREHLLWLSPLIDECQAYLRARGLDFDSLAYIAVTARPGLIGSLVLGLQAAKTLSALYGVPLVAVDHLEAHLAVWALEPETSDFRPEFPCLGLLLSGGNTVIYDYRAVGDLRVLGRTQDDALGEAFDKVGQLLGLGYPAGALIEAQARGFQPGDDFVNPFPVLLADRPLGDMAFSYSGIKTAVLRYLEKRHAAGEAIDGLIPEICFAFQERVFDLLSRRVDAALRATGYSAVICGGGVAANRTMRAYLTDAFPATRFYFPSRNALCADNGAMIAALGWFYRRLGRADGQAAVASAG